MELTVRDFDYPLDDELIAQSPLPERDRSRLMVLRREDGRIAHHHFFELPELLRDGDLLVLNDTRVIPAKFATRRRTGARIDGLFLREIRPGRWEVLLRNASRCRPGESLAFVGAEEIALRLDRALGEGRWSVDVCPPSPSVEVLTRAGTTPLPPYIHRDDSSDESADGIDRQRYQTVYADRPGAVAAPTAGLHFTGKLLERLTARGIATARVTLHVGMGTFAPVKVDDPSLHEMHSEWYDLPSETADAVNSARSDSRRVVAVGSTSVRVLEAAARRCSSAQLDAMSGRTDLFLYSPAEFRIVDAMITNFHLPRSTLLMLVAAFCSPGTIDGVATILNAYTEARRLRYRFHSYGDAMLIE